MYIPSETLSIKDCKFILQIIFGGTTKINQSYRPDEVIFFDLQTASKCQFGKADFITELFDTLKNYGCQFIDRKWVYNHTHLILWKLCGYCRCKPEEWKNWWNKDKIITELRYR